MRQAINLENGSYNHRHRFSLNLPFLITSTSIQGRRSSNPVDRVGSLLYFCTHSPELPSHSQHLPAYDPKERPAQAWNRLVQACAAASVWTVECGDCSRRNHFVEQLLDLFPHPSAQHWFPSWEQLLKYPDVSAQEEQIPDNVPPEVNWALRLYGGYLCRNVTIQLLDSHLANPVYVVAHFPDKSIHDSGGSMELYANQEVAGIPFIQDTSARYVLIDITPHRAARHDPTLDLDPEMLLIHTIVLCRELTAWKPPRSNWIDWAEGMTPRSLQDPNSYQYRLRRVTTLKGYTYLRTKCKWLPFTQADLRPRQCKIEGKTVHFWDPSIVVTLQ